MYFSSGGGRVGLLDVDTGRLINVTFFYFFLFYFIYFFQNYNVLKDVCTMNDEQLEHYEKVIESQREMQVAHTSEK